MDLNNSSSSTLLLDTSLFSLLLYNHLVCDTDGKSLLAISSRALDLLEDSGRKKQNQKLFGKILYSRLCTRQTVLRSGSICEHRNVQIELKGIFL
jgi:hypothetical protein